MARAKDNLIEVIMSDHRAVEEVFVELDRGEGDEAHRKDLVDHVITQLVRHSVAEEQFVYPAAREKFDDGDELADHEIEEHSEAERVMAELAGMTPTGPDYFRTVRKLIDDVRHHVEGEERDLLPRLEEACTAAELRELGQKVLQAKEVAPTRPHPDAPDRPPANLILDPGAGLVDKVRDALSGRAH